MANTERQERTLSHEAFRESPKILVCDPLPQNKFQKLIDKGYQVDFGIPEGQKLEEIIGNYDVAVVRSKTKITADVLKNPGKLSLLIRGGVGVDNIDVPCATDLGIVVANTPEANSVSAAELTWALILSVAKGVTKTSGQLRNGEWEKFKGIELKGKNMGVIGAGNIGALVAARAQGFEMDASVFDPYISDERREELEASGIKVMDSLDEILHKSDVISVHVPLNSETKGLIGKEALSKVKDRAIIINAARGGVVDEVALLEALNIGKVFGAGLDVFVNEPNPDKDLVQNDKVVATPHLGASTKEAESKVADQVVGIIENFLDGEMVRAINLRIAPETIKELRQYIPVSKKISKLASLLVGGNVSEVNISYGGEASFDDTRPLRAAVIEGLLSDVTDERINIVNHERVAKKRGIKVVEHKNPDLEHEAYTGFIVVRVRGQKGEEIEVRGLPVQNEARVIGIDDYPVEVTPDGKLLLCHNENVAGMVGKVTTVLGNYKVNIKGMSVANNKLDEEKALMAIVLESNLPEGTIKEIQSLEGISKAQFISLS